MNRDPADDYDDRMDDLRADAEDIDQEEIEARIEAEEMELDYQRDCMPTPHRWKP